MRIGRELPHYINLEMNKLGEYAWHYGNSEDQTGPIPDKGILRVLRDGSWRILPRFLRSANRHEKNPGDGSYDIGFRVPGIFNYT
jgi:formylglycine-generating enzyme required for sulfatase activity